MHIGETSTILRRSSRVPTAVQILVTSLKGTHFSEVCETLVVSAHGCAFLTRARLDSGVPLHFHSKDGRETTAHVVSCHPIGSDHRAWRLGAMLDRPENFWGLKDCPRDWSLPAVVTPPPLPQIPQSTNTLSSQPSSGQVNQLPEAVLDRVVRQFEAQMRRMIAESVRPLQAEITALKERLAQREANPSRFEVSLSSIPPELEQQVESRLRRDLGPRVVDEARQQSAQLLASAKAALEQRATESHQTFLRGVAHELKAVERRAQEISAQMSENTREHVRLGLQDFDQKLLDGGHSLKRLSEQLLEYLQQNLNVEHEARRADLEQLQVSVASESSRLQEQVEYLDARIAKLGESARCLESGLDQRLSRMSSDTVRDTRSQFESLANEIFEELTARSVKTLGDQLQETSANLRTVQDGIGVWVSESLRSQAANALQAFDQSMEQVARLSVDRWRRKLEAGLDALSKSLHEQFRVEAGAGDDAR